MKKKKFLFLSVLLIAMFLTGCATTTKPEDLKKSNDVANEIAANIGEYKIPDGYDMSYPDSKDTSRFYLTSKTEEGNTLKAEYKISNKEAELIAITVDDGNNLFYAYICFVAAVIGFLFGTKVA